MANIHGIYKRNRISVQILSRKIFMKPIFDTHPVSIYFLSFHSSLRFQYRTTDFLEISGIRLTVPGFHQPGRTRHNASMRNYIDILRVCAWVTYWTPVFEVRGVPTYCYKVCLNDDTGWHIIKLVNICSIIYNYKFGYFKAYVWIC